MSNYTDSIILWLLRGMCCLAIVAGWFHPVTLVKWFYISCGIVGMIFVQLLIIAECIVKCARCGCTVPHHEVKRSMTGDPLCRHCYAKSVTRK